VNKCHVFHTTSEAEKLASPFQACHSHISIQSEVVELVLAHVVDGL